MSWFAAPARAWAAAAADLLWHLNELGTHTDTHTHTPEVVHSSGLEQTAEVDFPCDLRGGEPLRLFTHISLCSSLRSAEGGFAV